MVIFIVLALIIWRDIPHIFPSQNLISRNNYGYTYRELRVFDWDFIGTSTWLDNSEAGVVDELVSILDNLSLRRCNRPKDYSEYEISFVATYKAEETTTYTAPVFSIIFYENNIIGFKEEGKYKEKYYKILDKDFNIKGIIENLQGSQV